MIYFELQQRYEAVRYFQDNVLRNNLKENEFTDLIIKGKISKVKLFDFLAFCKDHITTKNNITQEIFATFIDKHADLLKDNLKHYILPSEVENFSTIDNLLDELALSLKIEQFISKGDLICEIAKLKVNQGENGSEPEKILGKKLNTYNKTLYQQIAQRLFKPREIEKIVNAINILQRSIVIENFISSNKQHTIIDFSIQDESNALQTCNDAIAIQIYGDLLRNINQAMVKDLALLENRINYLINFIDTIKILEGGELTFQNSKDVVNTNGDGSHLQDKIDDFTKIANYFVDSICQPSIQYIFQITDDAENRIEEKINSRTIKDDKNISEENSIKNTEKNEKLSSILATIKQAFLDVNRDLLFLYISEFIRYINDEVNKNYRKVKIEKKKHKAQLTYLYLQSFWQKQLYNITIQMVLREDVQLNATIDDISQSIGENKSKIVSCILNADTLFKIEEYAYTDVIFHDAGIVDIDKIDKKNQLAKLQILVRSKVNEQIKSIKEDIDARKLTSYPRYCLEQLAKITDQYSEQKDVLTKSGNKMAANAASYLTKAHMIVRDCLENFSTDNCNIGRVELLKKYINGLFPMLDAIYKDKPLEEVRYIGENNINIPVIRDKVEDIDTDELSIEDQTEGREVFISDDIDKASFKRLGMHRFTSYFLLSLSMLMIVSSLATLSIGLTISFSLMSIGILLSVILMAIHIRRYQTKIRKRNASLSFVKNRKISHIESILQQRQTANENTKTTSAVLDAIAAPNLVVSSHIDPVSNHSAKSKGEKASAKKQNILQEYGQQNCSL